MKIAQLLLTVAAIFPGLGCQQPTPPAVDPGSTLATGEPAPTSVATAPAPIATTDPIATSPPTPTSSVSPSNPIDKRCASDSECPKGTHCALGMPLRGACWENGKPEPRCLSAETRIATPSGEVLVRDLRAGSMVWTLDADGARVAAPLVLSTHLPVAPNHMMSRVTFDDGRTLLVSPEHPICGAGATGNEETLGDLESGKRYDGRLITNAERVPYGESATFDILPAGATGCYWANGVLLGSTLSVAVR